MSVFRTCKRIDCISFVTRIFNNLINSSIVYSFFIAMYRPFFITLVRMHLYVSMAFNGKGLPAI